MISATHTEKDSRPELERDFQRNATLGYEPHGSYGFFRCLEHGAPNSQIRWHCHEEYELHLILETSGKMFVGDYIGRFEPGNLVLTGPRLPHNWISSDIPAEGIKSRDLAVQFLDEPLRKASELLPELKDILPLLEKAKNGIEFRGISEVVENRIRCIQNSKGARRFSEFLELLSELSIHKDYQLLSTVQLQSLEGDAHLNSISEVVDFLTENYDSQFTMVEAAEMAKMNNSQFSRTFKKATGNSFTGFVNRLRINRACDLLMQGDQYINSICYSVGFNNIANFNRRFVQFKGMTPSEFRLQAKARFG